LLKTFIKLKDEAVLLLDGMKLWLECIVRETTVVFKNILIYYRAVVLNHFLCNGCSIQIFKSNSALVDVHFFRIYYICLVFNSIDFATNLFLKNPSLDLY